jgi:hypothetical protein
MRHTYYISFAILRNFTLHTHARARLFCGSAQAQRIRRSEFLLPDNLFLLRREGCSEYRRYQTDPLRLMSSNHTRHWGEFRVPNNYIFCVLKSPRETNCGNTGLVSDVTETPFSIRWRQSQKRRRLTPYSHSLSFEKISLLTFAVKASNYTLIF